MTVSSSAPGPGTAPIRFALGNTTHCSSEIAFRYRDIIVNFIYLVVNEGSKTHTAISTQDIY